MEYIVILSGFYSTVAGFNCYSKYQALLIKNNYKNINLEEHQKNM